MTQSTKIQPVATKRPKPTPIPEMKHRKFKGAEPERRPDPFFSLTDEQKDAEVARFDRELDEREFRPLDRKSILLHEMAGITIPRNKMTVEITAQIIMEAERLAELNGVSLDHFVEESIRGMIAFTEPR